MTQDEREFSIPSQALAVIERLETEGFEAYLVGGCVRDLLLGIKPKDWDVTTNAIPEEIIDRFPDTFYENEYGTVGVVDRNAPEKSTKVIEVTPYRLESTYSNRRHPDKVTFSKKLEDDLRRRDLTINAIALKVVDHKGHGICKGHIVDLYKGQEDLGNKVLRTVGDPVERISEDALRIMRTVRIASELGFMINKETERAIKLHVNLLREISSERIRDEFNRIILSDRPELGLDLILNYGVLDIIIPEFKKGIGMKQNRAHSYDIWEHSLKALQHAAKKKLGLEVRLAVLFHDIGKIQTRRWSDEKSDWTFHGHDVIGARITAKILARFVYPKKTIDSITKLVRWHMFFSDTEKITLSSVRRLVKNVGKDSIWDLMDVRACDRIGTGRPKESPYRLRKYKSMVEEVMHDPVTVGMLKIDGTRIMEITGLGAGPKIGYILHALLEEVMENPDYNTREKLERLAGDMALLSEDKLRSLGEEGKNKKEDRERSEIKKIRDKYWVQ